MNTTLNPDPLVRFLGKPRAAFTRSDIVRYVRENGIEMINLRYPGADGRLKTLNFVINDEDYLESILTCGERVDGSSLFPYIEAGASDLYVVPRYRTAFRNPFGGIPAVDILCSYYTKDGEPLAMAPEQTRRRAHEELRRATGLDFHVMGELEFYVVSPKQDLFLAADQRGYHESTPFNKGAAFRAQAMKYIAQAGGEIKYGHSEVGNFTQGDRMYEQNEIEFLPTDLESAADQLVVAKWIIRTLACEYGVDVTFAPKITAGKAGSGLHVHTRLMRGERNAMVGPDGSLSDEALKAIAGYLWLAPSLTAFGNTNPTSYFRLVPHQEAPTNICWGDRNRSVLVRGLERGGGPHGLRRQSAGAARDAGREPQADRRVPLSRRLGRHLPAAGRTGRRCAPRLRDGERHAVRPRPLCGRQYLRRAASGGAGAAEPASRLVRGVGAAAGGAPGRLRAPRRLLAAPDRRTRRTPRGFPRRRPAAGAGRGRREGPQAGRNLFLLRLTAVFPSEIRTFTGGIPGLSRLSARWGVSVRAVRFRIAGRASRFAALSLRKPPPGAGIQGRVGLVRAVAGGELRLSGFARRRKGVA